MGATDPEEMDASSPWTHVQFDTSIVSDATVLSKLSKIVRGLTRECLHVLEDFSLKPSASSPGLRPARKGAFVVELYYKHAPRSCYNMAALAHAGYYNGTIFHRVVRDVLVQGGDPTGTGRGGESIYSGKFEDEITRQLKHTGAGVVAMANPGQKDSNGSQFYITLKPLPSLDGKHSIFGRIYSGMGVVQRLGMVATDADDRPLDPVTIHQAKPFRGPPPPKDEQVEHSSTLRIAAAN